MIKTPEYACNYAVLRFLPYPETGEFVNLGIVVQCSQLGLFEFRIEKKKTKRVTDFFPELDRNNYRAARDAIQEELERVRGVAPGIPPEGRLLMFRELVRVRQSIFRFGEVRTILARDPMQLADHLFDQYVRRHFAHLPEYQESVMAQRYFNALRDYRPDWLFRRNRPVGTEDYHVRIPICSDLLNSSGAPLRAIKPLDLDRGDTTAIIEHGDAWIARLRRLQSIGHMPDRFIFAVKSPADEEALEVAENVMAEIVNTGGTIIPADNTAQVVALATDGEESPLL